MDTAASGQANNDRASHPASERKDIPIPPGITEAARPARDRQCRDDKKLDTTTRDQANKGRAYRLPNGLVAVRYPPGMTEEIRQARNRQYWEDKRLAVSQVRGGLGTLGIVEHRILAWAAPQNCVYKALWAIRSLELSFLTSSVLNTLCNIGGTVQSIPQALLNV
ncbi:hypothetical protein VTK56DRAFT_5241 [Thermocarpiscus australiensis]